jgi:hypothetical protein
MMIEIFKKYASLCVTSMSVGSLIFVSGRESNRLDEVITKVHAAEVERKDTKDVLFDIHGRICSMEQDIKYIKERK